MLLLDMTLPIPIRLLIIFGSNKLQHKVFSEISFTVDNTPVIDL
jgi:hypothetical protein